MEFMPDYLSELALLLCCTAFIKIATVFSALRYGLGLSDMIFGVVSLIAALVFAFVIPVNTGTTTVAGQPFWKQVESQRAFLERNSDAEMVQKLDTIRENAQPKTKVASDVKDEVPNEERPIAKQHSIQSVLAGFLLAELQAAFYLGLLLLIPFVVIDVLVVNVLALLEITQISAVIISLPLKIGLFVGAGGWDLLVEKLLISYGA